jgi:death-on-curing protein
MTNYLVLDIEKVLYLHERIITQAGGVQGMRDFTLLHSALERCKATYAGEDLYPTLFEKAAALLHSLVMNHAFLDGNKRTAYEVMKGFLYFNGFLITASQKEIVRMCIAVDNEGWKVSDISNWLSRYCLSKGSSAKL